MSCDAPFFCEFPCERVGCRYSPMRQTVRRIEGHIKAALYRCSLGQVLTGSLFSGRHGLASDRLADRLSRRIGDQWPISHSFRISLQRDISTLPLAVWIVSLTSPSDPKLKGCTPQGFQQRIGLLKSSILACDPSKVGFFRCNGPGQATIAQSHITQAEYSLAGISIFADLNRDALERSQRRCSSRRYEPGESMADYLDASDDVFFISKGRLASPSIRLPARQ
jgi:hypothetical protein